jgi:hypothetical protein
MPATIRYRSEYPSPTKPLNSSVTFGNDGLVAVTASFLVSPANGSLLQIGQSLSPLMFPNLRGTPLQGDALFISARSIEKRGGLINLSVTALGAVNPPIFERSTESGARGFSKQVNFGEIQLTMSFDYIAQTNTATGVVLNGSRFDVSIANPFVEAIYNRNGVGVILSFNDDQSGLDLGQSRLVAQPRVLTTTSNTFLAANLVRRTVSKQFVYE